MVLKERLMLEARAMVFERHHFLYEIFDRKLQQYVEADLVNYNNKYFDQRSNPKQFEEYKEPFAVLTMEELEAGFVICFLPLFLSIVVFLVELVPTLKDLAVFLYIFKKFFEIKGSDF